MALHYYCRHCGVKVGSQLVVVADIAGQLLVFHMVDQIDDAV